MNVNLQEIAHISIWVIQILYFSGPLVLAVVNYINKSTGVLSDLMIAGYFLGYIFDFFYFYSADFPLPYKIKVPLALVVVVVLIYQRFHYNSKLATRGLVKILGTTLPFSLGIIFLVFQFKLDFHVFGWVAAVVWSFYQIPQIIKIFVNKSVKGFSFFFILIMTLGVGIDLLVSLFLNFPLPTILSCVRALVGYIILSVEFFIYKH